jgi:hypothetical protein
MFAVDEPSGLEVDPDSLTDGELAEAMVALRRQQARLAAATVRLTAAFDSRRVWAADGSMSAGAWLAHRCRLPAAEMRAQVRLGRRLGHMTVTAAAFETGDIAEPHASRLADMSVGRTAECFARDETLLVDWAQSLSPSRRVDLWEGMGGTGLLHGTLTPVARVALNSALRDIEGDLWNTDWAEVKEQYGPEATPAHITRTAAQRRHDALVELAHRACSTTRNSGKRPRPLISVLVDYPTFAGRVCQLGDGTVITPAVVASMLDDADIERVVFDAAGRVIDLGRRRRFVGAARRALEVRDRGCTHPGCDMPAERCEGDHIQPWSCGGTTHPDNGKLGCGHHNRWNWTHRGSPNDPGPPAHPDHRDGPPP